MRWAFFFNWHVSKCYVLLLIISLFLLVYHFNLQCTGIEESKLYSIVLTITSIKKQYLFFKSSWTYWPTPFPTLIMSQYLQKAKKQICSCPSCCHNINVPLTHIRSCFVGGVVSTNLLLQSDKFGTRLFVRQLSDDLRRQQ